MKKPDTHLKPAGLGVRCLDCGALIKANLAHRKGRRDGLLCFHCYRATQAARGHFMTTAREVRTGKAQPRGGDRE